MEHVGKAIIDVIRSLDLEPLMAYTIVSATWDNCVGELLQKQTRTVDYNEGVLTIAVRDATWKNHLVELSPQLIARLNASLDNAYVKHLEVVAKPELFGSTNISTPEDSISEQISEIDDATASAADSIKDPLLRDSFLRYARASKRSQKP
jgi:hypothetical protein